jgi:2-polyprenyl-3-methyl-5-hydroxy-6-metoxy-1,4-benzoquinol methylase
MKFRKYLGLWLFTLDGDDDHLYRAISPNYARDLSIIEDSKFFPNYEMTEHTVAVGPHPKCQVVKIKKYPFQIRIQETTRARALEIVKFLTAFAIDCHKKDRTPSDVHEANVLWWDKPIFVDFDALRPLTHANAALTFVRIGYLMYRYVFNRSHLTDHAKIDFAAIKKEGGWMAEQTERKDFTDPAIWIALEKVINGIRLPPHSKTHWSDEYATNPTKELAKNPKIAKVLDLVPPGRSLLDVGCNKGYVCSLLADRYESVVGFDNDEACIDRAFNEPGVNFAMFGIEHLALEEPIPIQERYHADVVLALAVTHHLKDVGMSVAFVAGILAGLTKKYLLIEDIVLPGEYRKEFERLGMEIVKRVPSYPTKRILTLWRKV